VWGRSIFRRLFLLAAGALALFAIAIALAPRQFAASSNSDSRLLYTVAPDYEPLAWLHGGDRFGGSATIFVKDSRGRHRLIHDFAASADPAVSSDGENVMFAGKQEPGEPWQIWEISLANGKPRRITSCVEDCIRPFYLPENRIVYAKKVDGRFVVEAATLVEGKAGAPVVRLTYAPGNSVPTDVLRDGRILFEATYPIGSSAETIGTPELYTVYSDGSGVESYRCDHGQARYAGKQISSGDIVFASHSGLGRFTSALAQEVPIAAPAGEYAGDPAETASGDWLLSWRPQAKAKFQLMHVGRTLLSASAGSLRPMVVEPNENVIQPTPITQRALPKRHPSALHDWQYANLLCLNAYTSKYKFGEGSIHSVRLYARDPRGAAKLLGTAPVESDGSFFLQVPADQPLQIELLDASAKILKRQAGWFWMRRGEQRVCVGCHTGPETAPENAVPMILLKSTTPADMMGTAAQPASGGH
jgi:Hydrazine synthase alpha subunit middle domain